MAKYKKGDVVKLEDRNGVKGKVVVICGLCYNGVYSTLTIEEYLVAKAWSKDPSESPARGRVAVEYADRTAIYLGDNLETIRIIYEA